MAELKAGGLAIITNSLISENIGVVVTCIEHIGVRISLITGERRDCWLVGASRKIKAFKGIFPCAASQVLTPTAWLMPIDDADPDAEIAKHKEREHA